MVCNLNIYTSKTDSSNYQACHPDSSRDTIVYEVNSSVKQGADLIKISVATQVISLHKTASSPSTRGGIDENRI